MLFPLVFAFMTLRAFLNLRDFIFGVMPTMWKTQVQPQGQEYPLEKEMATHSSTLAWKIPCTEERGRLQSMGVTKSWT